MQDQLQPGTQYTRCPHCETAFKVTAKMLALAKGKVRCGACLAVFQATDHLLTAKAKKKPLESRALPSSSRSKLTSNHSFGAEALGHSQSVNMTNSSLALKTRPDFEAQLNTPSPCERIEPSFVTDELEIPESFEVEENLQLDVALDSAEKVDSKESVNFEDNLDFEGDLESEDYLKFEEILESEDNLKFEETLEPEDNLKFEETLEPEDNLKFEETLESEYNLKFEDNLESEDNLKPEEILEPTEFLSTQKESEQEVYFATEEALKSDDFDPQESLEPVVSQELEGFLELDERQQVLELDDYRGGTNSLSDIEPVNNVELEDFQIEELQIETETEVEGGSEASSDQILENNTTNSSGTAVLEPIVGVSVAEIADRLEHEEAERALFEAETEIDESDTFEVNELDNLELDSLELDNTEQIQEDGFEIDDFDGTQEIELEELIDEPMTIDQPMTIDETDNFEMLAETLTSQIEETDTAPDPLDEFEERIKVKNTGIRSIMLSVVAIVLVAMASTQFWKNRQTLAWDESWGGVTQSVCSLFPCNLEPRRDVSLIRLRQRIVSPSETDENSLQIKILLTNEAKFEQPYPTIVMNFSNSNGKAVATKRFLVKEYFPEKYKELMPAATEVHISFETQQPHPDALGFEFGFE